MDVKIYSCYNHGCHLRGSSHHVSAAGEVLEQARQTNKAVLGQVEPYSPDASCSDSDVHMGEAESQVIPAVHSGDRVGEGLSPIRGFGPTLPTGWQTEMSGHAARSRPWV